MIAKLACLFALLISVSADVFTLTKESKCHSIRVNVSDICENQLFQKGVHAPFKVNFTSNFTDHKIWFGLSSKSSDDVMDSIEPYIIYSTQVHGDFVLTADLAQIDSIMHQNYCLYKIYLITCKPEHDQDISVSIDYQYTITRYFSVDDYVMVLIIIMLMYLSFLIWSSKYNQNSSESSPQPIVLQETTETDSEPDEETRLNRVSAVELV